MGLEKQMTLGEYLRTERELRGITLEQVASATKVGIRTLHALEADQYSELPAKPYIRGFVASYCVFIGLDPGEVRAQYDAFIDQKSGERPHRDSGHSGYAFEKKDGQQQSRLFLMITMCAFLVVGGIAVVFFKPALKHRKSSHLEKLKQAQEGLAPESSLGVGVPVPSGSPSSSPSSVDSGIGAGGEVRVLPLPAASITPEKQTESLSQVSESHSKSVGQLHGEVSTPSASPVQTFTAPQVEHQGSSQVSQVHGPTPIPSVGVNPHDPLDSGHEVALVEVKHHLTVKVFRDVWVRYRVDERPTRKFVIRAGKNLVLRARDRLVFQISDPTAATAVYNQKGAPELISHSARIKTVQGEATLVYSGGPVPPVSEILQEHHPLLKRVDPKP